MYVSFLITNGVCGVLIVRLSLFYLSLHVQVFATDRDEGPNSNVTYSFMAGTQTHTGCQNNQQTFPFKVDALTGEIVLVLSPPLFCSKYSCFIRGCDNPVDTNSRYFVSAIYSMSANG